MNKKTCVIVPAYNEAGSIIYVLESIASTGLDLDILVIDDGSTDETAALVRGKGVYCISHPVNCGVGAAIITGFHWASGKGYENVVIIDADGQHPSEYIDGLLTSLNDFELVIGTRDWKIFSTGLLRRAAHSALRAALKIKFGIDLRDITSGFRAFRIEAVRLLLPKLGDQYLEDTVMLLVEAKNLSLSIGQYPVSIDMRYSGKPSHGLIMSGVRYIGVIVKVLLHNKVRRR